MLGGCQSFMADDAPPPLAIDRQVTERHPPGCQGEHCPLVNVDTLVFADEPALNRLIDARLRAMTVMAPDEATPATLDGYQQAFLAAAEPGWSTYLQAKLRERHGSLAVLELSSYLFRGGAHGMPGRGFINFDLARDREVTLADALLPGQEARFWQLAEQAHRQWLDGNRPEGDPDFDRRWPFQRTPHVALLSDRVLLKYDVYSLGPYSMGHPELSIPYAQLGGVLAPPYLPAP